MSQAKQYDTSQALVIGAQGVLGGLLAQAFETDGWTVVRAGRRPGPGAGFRRGGKFSAEQAGYHEQPVYGSVRL